MALQAGSGRRERILVFGFSGAGKSTTWMNVAEWMYKTKSESKMYVVDNDMAWQAGRPLDGHLDDVVKVWDVETWQEHREAVRAARGLAKRDDWLVVDMADKVWNVTQNAYWQMAYGKEIDEIFLDTKINDFNLAGDYGQNWGAINKMYDAVWGQVSRAPCHVLCVTGGDEVRKAGKSGKGGDAPEITKAFGKYGIKPTGQKRLAHDFHTLLLAQETPSSYTLTTIKERNPPDRVDRPNLTAEKVKSGFTMQYLVKIANWKIGG